MTALTADQIKLGGIKSVEDAIQLDPSLSFDTGFSPNDTRIVIRGLSPTRGRPNVATLVDGIDVSSEALGTAGGSLLVNPKLLDIERIEVVKGPQSALYGRSAFAGAIQYVTKDPSKELTGEVAAEFGNFEHSEYRLELSAPIIGDVLGFRVTALKYEDDGFYRNQITENKVGGQEGEGVAVSFKFEPSDSLNFKLRYEYSHDAFEQAAQAYIGPNGFNIAPASASSCVGGPLNDPSCATVPVYVTVNPMDASAGYTIQNVNNLARILETRIGNTGKFNDMSVPSYRGSLGDAAGKRVLLSPQFALSQDGGQTAPDYPGSDRNVNRVSLVANFLTDFGTFSSLSGYTDARVSTVTDLDHYAVEGPTGNDVSPIQQTLDTFGKTWQFSQELRFTSDFDGPVNFVTGLQYWEEHVNQFENNFTAIAAGTRCQLFDTPGPAPIGELSPGSCTNVTTSVPVGQYVDDVVAAAQALGGGTYVDRYVEHKSAYLQLGWQITDAWSASIEGRYAEETNEVSGPDPVENPAFQEAASGPGSLTLCGSNGPCTLVPRGPRGFAPVRPIVYRSFERDDSYFVPRASIDWRVADNALLYASYSKGQKPGGFATLSIGSVGLSTREDIEFEPEKITQYELGWKTSWLDRSLTFNGALFYNDFTDKQVSTQAIVNDQLTNVIKNASGAEVKGVELATQWRPLPQLTLAAAYTYLDATYSDYIVEGTGAPEISRVGNCVVQVVDTLGTTGLVEFRPNCLIDRSGNKMEDTPEHAFSTQIGWRQALGNTGFDWFADLTGRYTGKRFLEDDNSISLDAYWLADLRVGFDSDNWTIIGFVDNVLDDDTIKVAGTGPAISVANFRLGQIVAPAGPANGTGGRATGIIPSPIIPSLVFANMPDPRTYRVQVAYKFN